MSAVEDRSSVAFIGASQRGRQENFPQRATQSQLKKPLWDYRCERWGLLMAAAQNGAVDAYDSLLRELDSWLRRYYARRLPHSAAEDARQEALLAIHLGLYSYKPSKPFGPWVVTIARNKWIDYLRAASRHEEVPLDEGISIEDRQELLAAAGCVDKLIRRLKPAQADVIRLVKLQGISIQDASALTGQTSAVVKVNIHRGLKTLSALANGNASTMATCDGGTGSSRAARQRGPRLARIDKVS